MYDCLIIGGGIAGLTAAIYTARAGLKVAVIEGEQCGGQAVLTSEIENYPGFTGSGYDLAVKTEEQAVSAGAEIIYDEIISADLNQDIKTLTGESGSYTSKAVIIATGAKHRKAGFDGEEEFAGAGVSYCAVCDGAFFEGKDVAVIGGANSAVSEAVYLSKICRKVYIIYRRDALRAHNTLVERVRKTDNIEVIYNTVVKAVSGKNSVEKIITDKSEIDVKGVFVSVGLDPHTEIFKEHLDLDEKGYIKTGYGLKTNVSGVFAAGDCLVKSLRQLITAASDGAVAAEEVIKFLRQSV